MLHVFFFINRVKLVTRKQTVIDIKGWREYILLFQKVGHFKFNQMYKKYDQAAAKHNYSKVLVKLCLAVVAATAKASTATVGKYSISFKYRSFSFLKKQL
jgi:hypothetical protein